MQNTSGIDNKIGINASTSPKDAKETKKVTPAASGSADSAGANSEPASKKDANQASSTPNSGGPQAATRSANANGTASKKDLLELKEEGISAQMIPWVEDKNN